MRSRRAPTACVLLAVVLSTGCRHSFNTPGIPAALQLDKSVSYTTDQFNSDYAAYKKAVAEKRLADARIDRDVMVNRIEVDIEANYRDFEAKLASTRAGIDTGADVVELGLSAATGVVSGSDIKDLLAASLTGFKGTRLSLDKNVFRQKTTEILISQMQADRDAVRNRITQKLSSMDVTGYPFEEAWRDLVEFFYAGTLQAALQQLSNDAGNKAAVEKAAAKQIDVSRANTAEEAQMAVRIRQKYFELYQLAQSRDAATQKSARTQLQQILTALGKADLAKSDNTDDLLKALQTQMQHALTDPAQIRVLDKVLTPAPQL